MHLGDWIIEHWDEILQNAGVVSGLFVAAVTLHTDARVRRAETLFKMNEHRELWMHFYSRPELAGILHEWERSQRRWWTQERGAMHAGAA